MKKQILCIVACVIMLFGRQDVYAQMNVPEQTYTPTVFTEEVTNDVTELSVYVYENTTLYVESDGSIIFEKYYSKEGKRNIVIPAQNTGSKLYIYLVSEVSGKKGETIIRTVQNGVKFTSIKVDTDLVKPYIQGTLTNKTTSIKVKGKRGQTLVIENESGVVKKIHFRKNSKKRISIPKQSGNKLYFYFQKGKVRSDVVTKHISDVIAPKKPKVKSAEGNLIVKGEVGAKVYVRYGSGRYNYSGVILNKSGLQVAAVPLTMDCPYYYIKLRDDMGNNSKVVKVKDKFVEENGSVLGTQK